MGMATLDSGGNLGAGDSPLYHTAGFTEQAWGGGVIWTPALRTGNDSLTEAHHLSPPQLPVQNMGYIPPDAAASRETDPNR